MLLSMYILCFNHEKYIEEAVKGAFAQTYSPLEIIISDDCSSDKTWEIIQNLTSAYQGPHKIIVRQNSKNLGISEHINEIWKICSGEWILASASDDISYPERASETAVAISRYPNIKLFQAWLNEVDYSGKLLKLNELNCSVEAMPVDGIISPKRFIEQPFFQHGAAMAYSNEIFKVFGPLPAGVIFEDNIVNVRAELLGGCAVIARPLVNHRNHSGQITNTNARSSLRSIKERLKMIYYSDVLSSNENLKNYSHVPKINISGFKEYGNILKRRNAFFKCRFRALVSIWPLRILFLLLLLARRPWSCKIRGREILFMGAPIALIQLIANIRIRFHGISMKLL